MLLRIPPVSIAKVELDGRPRAVTGAAFVRGGTVPSLEGALLGS
jgi:hypothetical protein